VANVLRDYGERVQFSVFGANLKAEQVEDHKLCSQIRHRHE
jgi:hypothetical protein